MRYLQDLTAAANLAVTLLIARGVWWETGGDFLDGDRLQSWLDHLTQLLGLT